MRGHLLPEELERRLITPSDVGSECNQPLCFCDADCGQPKPNRGNASLGDFLGGFGCSKIAAILDQPVSVGLLPKNRSWPFSISSRTGRLPVKEAV